MKKTGASLLLADKTVVWTGSADSGDSLLDGLTEQGAAVERHPLIEIVPIPEAVQKSDLLALPHRYSWILFTSAAAADAVDGMPQPMARVGAVGPRTAARLRDLGWVVDLVPTQHRAAGLAEELLKQGRPEKPILFLRGDRASRDLVDILTAQGLEVHETVVYATAEVSPHKARQIAERIATVADVVVMASPSGVETLAAALRPRPLSRLKPGLKWTCLGPATANALALEGIADAGYPEKVEAQSFLRLLIAAITT